MLKSSNNGIFSAPAAPSVGTTVAQSGSANTFGSYVQVVFPGTSNNTNEADFIVAVRYSTSNTNTPTYLSVEIGTGAAGSETVVGIANCPTPSITISGGPPSVGVQIISGRVDLPFPIPVATGTRVAVKTASDVASAISWKIWLECYKQADLVDGGVNESSNVVQINGQTATASGGITFPAATLASTTNITAGTMTTTTNATNVTNAVTISAGTGTGQLDFTSGVVKANVTQINAQTASASGTVTFPAATLASSTNITAATGITVSTNSDKTGYSLSQTFPTNFSSLGITAGGHVSNVDLVTSDVQGKVLGGGSSSLSGVGVQADTEQIAGQPAKAFLSNSSRSALGR